MSFGRNPARPHRPSLPAASIAQLLPLRQRGTQSRSAPNVTPPLRSAKRAILREGTRAVHRGSPNPRRTALPDGGRGFRRAGCGRSGRYGGAGRGSDRGDPSRVVVAPLENRTSNQSLTRGRDGRRLDHAIVAHRIGAIGRCAHDAATARDAGRPRRQLPSNPRRPNRCRNGRLGKLLR